MAKAKTSLEKNEGKTIYPFFLIDPITGDRLNGILIWLPDRFEFRFDGYDKYEKPYPLGTPVTIEFVGGELKVQIKRDVNERGMEMTSLEKARESNREEEPIREGSNLNRLAAFLRKKKQKTD